jgi:hypothetical protein
MVTSFAPWLGEGGHLFHPQAVVRQVPILPGEQCIVIDNALADPQSLRHWAAGQSFLPPVGYPYPGLVTDVPVELSQRVAECFALTARSALHGRRTLDIAVRLSLITTPPAELSPIQWLCHRDRFVHGRSDILFAAGVLYLFADPTLGGTSFYLPRQAAAQTEQLVADSQTLDAPAFSARHGWPAGYMNGSNTHFERVAQVPAAWNRMIFYNGGLFHSADVAEPPRMTADPLQGRLTLNSFITCRKTAS